MTAPVVSSGSLVAASPEDRIVEVSIIGTEKRREGGKHYVYRMIVVFASGCADHVWRRYSQFDALRETMAGILGPIVTLPKLTSKKYLGRSSVHQVAEYRTPKLQRFVSQLLTFRDNPVLTKTFQFFLTPTAEDDARLAQGLDSPSEKNDADAGGASDDEDETVVPGLAEALWDYTARDEDEINIWAGDQISLFRQIDVDWLEGQLNGRVGLFPASYVKVLQEPSSSSMTVARVASPTNGSTAQLLSKPKTPGEELLSTEISFAANLVSVREKFFPRMRHCITASEAKTLFNNWIELISCSQELVEALQKMECSEAEVLNEHLPRLVGPYSKYCVGIPAAQAMYEKKLHERDFIEFEKSFVNMNKPTFNHIMRPVQRIMKYPLIISELLKDNSLSPADRLKLNTAMDAATKLATSANSSMSAPKRSLAKLDISGPDTDSFQHIVGLRGEGQTDDNSTQSAGMLPPFLVSDHHMVSEQLVKKKSSFPSLLKRLKSPSQHLHDPSDSHNQIIEMTMRSSFDTDEDDGVLSDPGALVVSPPLGRKPRATNLLPASMRSLPPSMPPNMAEAPPGSSLARSIPWTPSACDAIQTGPVQPSLQSRSPAALRCLPAATSKPPDVAGSTTCHLSPLDEAASLQPKFEAPPDKAIYSTPHMVLSKYRNPDVPAAVLGSVSSSEPQPGKEDVIPADVFNVRLRSVTKSVSRPQGGPTSLAPNPSPKFAMLPPNTATGKRAEAEPVGAAVKPPLVVAKPVVKPTAPGTGVHRPLRPSLAASAKLSTPFLPTPATSLDTVTAPTISGTTPKSATGSRKPVITATKPAITAVKPMIAASKPASSIRVLGDSVEKPAVIAVKPVIIAAKPAIGTVKPSISAAKTATAVRPGMELSKPTKTTAVKPEVQAIKPVVTAAKPAANRRVSSVGKAAGISKSRAAGGPVESGETDKACNILPAQMSPTKRGQAPSVPSLAVPSGQPNVPEAKSSWLTGPCVPDVNKSVLARAAVRSPDSEDEGKDSDEWD